MLAPGSDVRALAAPLKILLVGWTLSFLQCSALHRRRHLQCLVVRSMNNWVCMMIAVFLCCVFISTQYTKINTSTYSYF
jgi:hypothetical protein